MDHDWALDELRTFRDQTILVASPPTPGVLVLGDTRVTSGNRAQIVAAAQVVEQILDRTLPRWRQDVEVDESERWQQHHEAALRAIAQLERQAEIADKLGDNAPLLDAASLHAWVWDAARSLWRSGHFREAVRAASVKVNAEAQNKLRTSSELARSPRRSCFRWPLAKMLLVRVRPDFGFRTTMEVRPQRACGAE